MLSTRGSLYTDYDELNVEHTQKYSAVQTVGVATRITEVTDSSGVPIVFFQMQLELEGPPYKWSVLLRVDPVCI